MSSRLKFMIPAVICLVVLQMMCSRAPAQANSPKDKGKTEAATLFGSAALATNYVEKGVTQTDNGPAVQAGFGYKWTNGRLGLWGSSVKFEDENVSMNLQPYFLFSPDPALSLRYSYSKYLSSGSRDTSLIAVDWLIFGYNFLIERDENFEGSHEARLWLAGHKKYDIPYDLQLGLTAGVSSSKAPGAGTFFDVRSDLLYAYKDLLYTLGLTYCTKAQSGVGFYLQVSVDF